MGERKNRGGDHKSGQERGVDDRRERRRRKGNWET